MGKYKVGTVIDIALRKDREPGENPFAGTTGKDLKDKTKFMSIKEVAAAYDFVTHALYVSQLIKAGKLEGIKIQLPGKEKWFVSVPSVEYYNAHKNTRTGMRRWLLRCSESDIDAVREAIEGLEIEFTLEANYKAKKGSGSKGKSAPRKAAKVDEDFELEF